MSVVSLPDRAVYLYSEVDRLIGLRSGTARRWINGYTRSGRFYQPILRVEALDTEWATWGEFVETRILAEYRDQDIPTARLRAAVTDLRDRFDVAYPLAYLRPYLAVENRELALSTEAIAPSDEPGLLVVRTKQLLLGTPGRKVIENATLAADDRGEKYAAELPVDLDFPGIVINPDRLGGRPTFAGRRVSVATIAGMVAAGEREEDLAADYGLSLAQIRAAVDYAGKHGMAAA